MPRTPRSLVTAARLQIAEDRLTELVAACANRSVVFANALLELAGLAAGTSALARTQVWTQSGRRVDMEIVALDATGAKASHAWFEHKLDRAVYQHDQLEDYAADLGAVDPFGRLVTVVPNPTQAATDPARRWDRLTWHDVARAAWATGHDRTGDARWRAQAGRPTATADVAVLEELLSYLEEEYSVVADPLAPNHVLAFAGYIDAYETLDSLLKRAAMLTGFGHGEVGWDEGGTAWVVLDVRGSWSAALQGAPELHLGDTDYWATTRREHPALGAGLTLPESLIDQVRDAAHQQWRQDVLSAGYGILHDDRESCIRIYRTRYLVELMTAGVTLDEQARDLAAWTVQAITEINQLVPDPLFVVPEKKARRRGRAGLTESVEVPSDAAPTGDAINRD